MTSKLVKNSYSTVGVFTVADHGCDVWLGTGSPVSPDYRSRGNQFNGVVKGAQIAIAGEAVSTNHLISPEGAVGIAMARQ